MTSEALKNTVYIIHATLINFDRYYVFLVFIAEN